MAKRPLHRVSRYVGMAAIAATVAAATVACGSDDSSAGSGYTGTVGKVDLSKVCPAKIVVQTDWAPESEHGHLYQLLGPDAKIDAGAKKVVGPLFTGGEYTGVDIEIRAGGPAIGNQSVVSTMYQDPSIMLGYVDTDQAVQTSKQFPTTAVMASVDISPQMIMWDPATYPQVTKIADLKPERYGIMLAPGGNILPVLKTWKNYAGTEGAIYYYYDFPKNKMNDWLVAEYTKRYKSPPDFFTAGGFAAASAALTALTKAGSSDTEKLIAAMEGMEFDTPKGKMTFRKEDHQAMQPMYHFRIKKNQASEWDLLELVREIPASELPVPIRNKR